MDKKEWEEQRAEIIEEKRVGRVKDTCYEACIKLNPEDPQAVAEGIEDLVEALEDIVNQAKATRLPLGADLADSINVFGKQALKKVKGE